MSTSTYFAFFLARVHVLAKFWILDSPWKHFFVKYVLNYIFNGSFYFLNHFFDDQIRKKVYSQRGKSDQNSNSSLVFSWKKMEREMIKTVSFDLKKTKKNQDPILKN